MDKLTIHLDKNVDREIEVPSLEGVREIIVDKSSIGENEDEKLKHNLYASARKDIHVKKLVIKLANQGFFMVKHENGISTFEKLDKIERFKKNFTDQNIKTYSNLVYTIQAPKIKSESNKLLVVFSSVADFPLNASISRRNFFKNFETIAKYIPHDTYVLRISDIGGVVGSFYLNTTFDKNREESIQGLLSLIVKEKNIKIEDVVLYGVSKGATGALYHSIKGGYQSVCVDPIVSDDYHEKKYNDPHFTSGGIFPLSKQEKFVRLLKQKEVDSNINIIYSNNSPTFAYINAVIRDYDIDKKIHFIDVPHPEIKEHPDVGPKTINVLTLIINNLFYKIFEKQKKFICLDSSDSNEKK